MPVADPPELLKRLREGTRSAHRQLDHHPLLAPLVRPELALENYGSALAALLAPHASLEEILADFVDSANFPPRAHDLAHDLAVLERAPCTLGAAVPVFWSPAEKIGALYVIEGSGLGAVVIARQLRQSLPEGTSMRFFAGSGGWLRWENFWQFASHHCETTQADAAISAARATFDFYHAHLDACLNP